ncbi:MAG TPA: Gldg family protein, partial [Verrucomicrobiae bacterium]|nr:Gldg family protein [Verrucomicrobiae bacterium]
MADESEPKPSFSPFRKWVIALNVGLVVALVFGVVVMVNYVSRQYFLRLHVSTQSKVTLFPRTVKFLAGLTNSVKVTLYYDKEDPFYSTIAELLNEYHTVNRKISIRIVDYKRDPGAAQVLRTNYTWLGLASAKNLVIFDGGEKRIKAVDGNALVKYVQEQVPSQGQIEFSRKPTFFEGERAFTAALIAVTSPNKPKVYFLTRHGEHDINSDDEQFGYKKLATQLQGESYLQLESISLLDTNHPVPADCNLLVIPGPRTPFEDSELEAIDQYLSQGGRLFALFSALSLNHGDTGLEKILAKWGVNVSNDIISDPDARRGEQDVIVGAFSNHPIVSPLTGLAIHMILPRSIGKLSAHSPAADAPNVEEIAFSGPHSLVANAPGKPHRAYPLVVAVDKGSVKGVITEHGMTRILVTGDSIFLANHQIESAANRDFGTLAVNWLLDRPQLVEGIGPRPITEYRLVMTRAQVQGAEWILLGGMPGAVLLLGGVVWLRRRS